MNRRIAIGIGASAIGVLALFGLSKHTFDRLGRRLLQMEVYLEDTLVLRTIFDAPDREGSAYFWRRAGEEPFASEVVQVRADELSPLRATLTGPVRIKIMHVHRLMTNASLTNLVLLRSTSEAQKWHLSPGEVQRAKRAAGL